MGHLNHNCLQPDHNHIVQDSLVQIPHQERGDGSQFLLIINILGSWNTKRMLVLPESIIPTTTPFPKTFEF